MRSISLPLSMLAPKPSSGGGECRLSRLLVILCRAVLAPVTAAAVDASVLVLVVITLPLIPPSLRPFLRAVLRPFLSTIHKCSAQQMRPTPLPLPRQRHAVLGIAFTLQHHGAWHGMPVDVANSRSRSRGRCRGRTRRGRSSHVGR